MPGHTYELEDIKLIPEFQETKDNEEALLGKNERKSILKTLFSGNNLSMSIVFGLVIYI